MTVISTTGEVRARDNVRGIVAMVVAVAALTLMDSCLKVLSPHYSPLQVTTLRAASAIPLIAVWVAATGGFGQLLNARWSLHVARALLGIAMLALFTFALRELPLTEAYAIFFVAPLLITVFAALVLRERVGRARWLAIAIGFIGMLVVLRPTGASAITLPGLAVLGTAIGYALSAITVRVLGRTDSTQTMVFWLMTLTAVGAGLMSASGWRPIQTGHWLTIAAMAATGFVGQWAITEAFRIGEASVVAPFEYTALAWGAGMDWLIWRTVPGLPTLAGAGVIIASGIYLVRRERVHVEAEHP